MLDCFWKNLKQKFRAIYGFQRFQHQVEYLEGETSESLL